MKIKDSQTILFTGDSITDYGRAYPVGEGDELGGWCLEVIEQGC